jgi:predicted permease
MVAGVTLNLLGVSRPAFVDSVVAVLVPGLSVMIGIAIGVTLRFSKISRYWKEIGVVAMIKFLIVPAVMIPLGILVGLRQIDGGLPFKMLVVLSVMPVAVNSLVPPAIFGFDLDLANSAWIVTTAALAVIVPVLYLVLL